MSVSEIRTVPRWQHIGLWSVKALLALAFLAAGGAKLGGAAMMVENFAQIGLGQWFRYVTGALEVIGAILILIPALAAFGGVLLAVVMVGATVTHLVVLPGTSVPAIILFLLCALVVFAHRGQILGLAGSTSAGEA
jgi:putative oxidoreductase